MNILLIYYEVLTKYQFIITPILKCLKINFLSNIKTLFNNKIEYLDLKCNTKKLIIYTK